jgi:hypothetical protein
MEDRPTAQRPAVRAVDIGAEGMGDCWRASRRIIPFNAQKRNSSMSVGKAAYISAAERE